MNESERDRIPRAEQIHDEEGDLEMTNEHCSSNCSTESEDEQTPQTSSVQEPGTVRQTHTFAQSHVLRPD